MGLLETMLGQGYGRKSYGLMGGAPATGQFQPPPPPPTPGGQSLAAMYRQQNAQAGMPPPPAMPLDQQQQLARWQKGIDNVAASGARMAAGQTVMPGVLNDDEMPDMTNDPMVGTILAARNAPDKAAALIASMGLPSPSQAATDNRYVPGESAAGQNVAMPPINPHQPQLPTSNPAGFDGRSGMERVNDRDLATMAGERAGEMGQWEAGNQARVEGSLAGSSTSQNYPQNSSEMWQVANAEAPAHKASQITGARGRYDNAHPGARFGQGKPGTMQVAMADHDGDPSNGMTPRSANQIAAGKVQEQSRWQDAGKDRFGAAYNSIVGDAAKGKDARQMRMAGFSDQQAYAGAEEQALMNSILGGGDDMGQGIANWQAWKGDPRLAIAQEDRQYEEANRDREALKASHDEETAARKTLRDEAVAAGVPEVDIPAYIDRNVGSLIQGKGKPANATTTPGVVSSTAFNDMESIWNSDEYDPGFWSLGGIAKFREYVKTKLGAKHPGLTDEEIDKFYNLKNGWRFLWDN